MEARNTETHSEETVLINPYLHIDSMIIIKLLFCFFIIFFEILVPDSSHLVT